ncbi:hypothetical protein IC235_17695 [Hymenobacter sp. BT664]|uniref:Uncharacterized protein n=1 Tax=Hymenobacter montanus TaxID=2771359 RepID=A0A927BGS6_9BACT|nr:hypothetical protein [Hymenobacter montanus]MBD2769727.1 hypothetical protein [Hymenobacter montanus]
MRTKIKASDIVQGLRLIHAGMPGEVFTMGKVSQYYVGSSPTRGGELYLAEGIIYEHRKYNCASLQRAGFTLAPPVKPAE